MHFKGTVLYEGFVNDLIAMADFGMIGQKFKFNHEDKRFHSLNTGNVIDVQKVGGSEHKVMTSPYDD